MSKSKKPTPTAEELKQQAAEAVHSINSTMWQIGQEKPVTPGQKVEVAEPPPVQPEPDPVQAAQTPQEEQPAQEPTQEAQEAPTEGETTEEPSQEPADTEPATEPQNAPQEEPVSEEPKPAPAPETKPTPKPKSYTPPNLEAQAPAQPQQQVQSFAMSEEEEENLRILRKMEGMYGNTYRGIADRTVKFWSEEQKWIENWQAKNPDDQFDPNSNQEYASWVNRNEPKFEQFHFKKAEKAIWQEEVETKAEQRIREVEDRKRSEQVATSEPPEVVQAAFTAFSSMVTSAAPELGKAMAQAKGYNPDAMAQIDPVANAVVLEEGEELHALVRTVEKLARMPNPADAPKLLNNPIKLKAAGRTIRPLDAISDFVYETEQAIRAMPQEQQIDQNGRRFIPMQEYQEMLAKFDRSRLSDREKATAKRDYMEAHWTLGIDELRQSLTDYYAARAKTRIGKLKPQGQTPKAQTPAAPQKPVAQTPQNPPGSRNRTASPAVVSASDAPNPGKQVLLTKQEENKLIEQKMWGL